MEPDTGLLIHSLDAAVVLDHLDHTVAHVGTTPAVQCCRFDPNLPGTRTGNSRGIDPAVYRGSRIGVDQVIRMRLTGSDHSNLRRTRTASRADRTSGGRVVNVASEVHDVTHLEFQCRRGRRSRTDVVDPGKLSVLLPGTCVVSGLGANVPHSGDLNTILPFGRALNGKSIPN